MTLVVLKPPTEVRRRQQDPCRTISYAATGLKALLRRPRYYLYRAQGAPPAATLLSVQSSGHFPASHVSSKLHPHYTAGHLLVSIKGGVQGPAERGREGRGTTGGWVDARQRDGRRQAGPDPHPLSLALSYSLSRSACNPYYEHPGAG
jgi:hypothetical protein